MKFDKKKFNDLNSMDVYSDINSLSWAVGYALKDVESLSRKSVTNEGYSEKLYSSIEGVVNSLEELLDNYSKRKWEIKDLENIFSKMKVDYVSLKKTLDSLLKGTNAIDNIYVIGGVVKDLRRLDENLGRMKFHFIKLY